jgi:hypothetical protein
MTTEAIFFLQFSLSLLVFGLLARWLLAPWLAQQSVPQAIFWLIIPHAFRHIGMVFLVPGMVASLPQNFALVAAYGDLAAGLLAILALIALRSGWKTALLFVWVFNLAGTIDLFNALSHMEVISSLGAAWYIPTMLVPLLLITHFMIFAQLISYASREGRTAIL